MKNSNMYLGRRWYGISRKWFENDSVMTRKRVGSVVSRFSLASLICLCMLTIGMGNAWGADLTISLNFNQVSGGNLFSLSTSSGNDASTETSKTYGGYTYKLKAANSCYYYSGNVSGTTYKCLLMGKTNSYIVFPAISDKKLTKVTIGISIGSSTATVAICEGNTSTVTTGGAEDNSWSKGETHSWTLTNTSANTAYSARVTSNHNIQITTIELEYTNVGGGGGSKYTVSFNTGTGNPTQANITEASSGAGITLPNVTPNCSDDGWALYGWATSACSSETAVAPSIVGKAGDTYNPASNTTLYAVYAKGEYTKETSSITSGSKYLIVANSGGHNHIMKSSSDDFRDYSGYHGMAAIQIDETYTGKYHASSINPSWCYSIEGTSGNYFIRDVVNNSNSNYADIAYGEWWGHAIDNGDKYTITVSSGIWTIKNNYYNSGYSYLGYDSSDDAFFAFGSAKEILLYRAGTIAYFSNPSCEACTADPTVGVASLNGSFSLSSVGVTATGWAPGANCSWEDYGFVWGTSANPTISNNKVQIGTSGTATTWDGNLTGSFTVGTTYHYRAYGKNGKAGAVVQYSSDQTFIPRSVTLMDYTTYATVYAAHGTPAVKPEDPTKSGYTFAGWYKEEGLINAVNWSDNITENKTYYAKWTGIPYTITLDNQDATTTGTTSISVVHGENTNLTGSPAITIPTKTGYTFGGYYTEEDGEGGQIIDASGNVNAEANDGSDYWTGEDKEWLQGDATLYAKWTINNYTVSWSVNGSTWSSGVSASNNNANYGSTVSAPTAPTSSDCDDSKVFVGWTDAEYSNPSAAPTTLFTSTSPAITTNTTFYAVFAEASSGGGGGTATSITSYEDGDYYIIDSFTDSGDNTTYYSPTGAATTSVSAVNLTSYVSVSSGILTLDLSCPLLSEAMVYSISQEDGNYYIYNAENEKYIGSNTSGAALKVSKEGWSLLPNDKRYMFWVDASTDRCLLYQDTYKSGDVKTESHIFKCYAKSLAGDISQQGGKECYGSGYFFLVPATTTTYSDYTTSCCQQPATQLSMSADKTELVRSGVVEFTLAGGNGEDITWSCRDEADNDCDALLTSTSNSGATLTISSPVATTKTYTVKAVQPENDDDTEVICGKTLTIDITVKTQWTITFKTKDESVLTTYSTTTVTDGDTYIFPDLSDDYTCDENYSFAGWKAANSDGAPEHEGGSSAKATENTTWYAVWMHSTGTTTETRDKYELVTSSSAAIAENDVVVIAYNSQGVALAQMTASDTYGSPVAVDFAADKSYLTFASGTNVMELKVLNYADEGADSYYFVDNANTENAITIASSSPTSKLLYSEPDEDGPVFWTWKITITVQNNATIEDYVNSEYAIEYNSSNNRFAYYKKTQKKVQLYRKNGTISVTIPNAPTYSVNNEHCTNGATIRANGGQWITSAKDQKVRITVPVTAKNFETSGKQITGSSDNAHFAVSVASHTIPSNKSESAPINVTIEYTPAEANVIETANITLTTGAGAGDATKVIEVNGRSLPDEFVIVMQKEGKWQALPANMESGATTYSGVEVTPNGGITAIPAAPFNVIYSAREVASSRYEAAGNCVRLVGNNNKCLWGNNSTNTTSIQNWSTLSNTNGAQYEWLLSTADGETYTIANPNHPDYATGRQLAIYALKYGLYKTDATFYLLPVGCSSQPGNLQIVPRRIDATFSWISNASSVTIDLWTNEEMDEGHLSATATSVPYLFTGLAESTQYWYKITPGSDDDCAVTGTFSTTGPSIDVVEWGENSATIFVDIDPATANDPSVSPQIIIAGEVEHGQGSGAAATDIFFSKYFEAEGTAKMLAIYNGTGNAMSLADITILHRSTTKNYTPLSLASYGKTAGWIQPGEEIILFNRDARAAVMSCAESDPTYPSWNNVENKNLEFSGKGTIRLFRGNECIDIIGAMVAGDDINDKAVDPIEGSDSPTFGDANGFVSTSGDNYATKGTVENNYELSTNRCLLIRQNWVTSGDSAVLNNFDDFKTLGTYTGVDSKTHKGEWAGLQIPTAVAPETDYIHTCEGFQEVGKFDYNKYYREYDQIGDDKYLKDFTRAEDGTYTLPISYMRQYACLNLKFQLTDHSNKETILTEKVAQVPIVVKDARNSNDTLFTSIIKADEAPHAPMITESIERCKTCNVVVLGTGILTKAVDGATNDVAELGDVKVYPGGKLIVPSDRHYVFNSLAMRRQEDEVALADIQGGLAESATDASDKGLYIRRPNGVYLDVRINPDNWHFIALPYDCRVGDIMLSDGTPAVVNTDYLLGWYDGAKRAANKSGGWTYITDKDYVLKKGLGYILALPGTDKVKKELRFPMANSVIDEELSDKSIGGLYAYGGDKSDEELRPNHKGWNMIGNPYMITYETDIVETPLAMGLLEHDLVNGVWYGQWKRTGSARYIVKPVDNGWSDYIQTTITDLEPFTSYFIQIGNSTDGSDNPETENNITFTASKAERASIIRHAPAETDEPMYPVWYGVDIIAPNAERDNTTLLISDEFTDGYDMMDDLVKMRGDYYTYYNKPVLASRNNEGEMAFNALPDNSAAEVGVPLNYYAAQAGTYTIATDSRYDLEEVKSAVLYDATNNTYTDLLTQNYEFTASKGNNTERFTLYVRVERKKAPNQETDVDNILADGKLSLISMGKTLVLSGLTGAADVYVYDMSGKLMNSDHISGSGGIWRTTVPATGVYFVRVNGVNGQQTLRAIVK